MKNVKNNIRLFFLLFYSIAIFGQEEQGIINDPISYSFLVPIDKNSMSCPCRPSYSYTQLELDILYIINQHRQSLGLSTVSLINHISNNCLDHNNYMIPLNPSNVPNHNFFQQRADNIQCALNAVNISEIVQSNTSSVSAFNVVNAFLNSSSHRAIIENGIFNRIGISEKLGNLNRRFFTIIFTSNTSGSCASVTNPCNVSPPITLSTSNVNHNSALLNWNNISGSNGYQIQFKETSLGQAFWQTAGSVSSGITNYSLSGLNPTTAYQWRIRSLCSNGLYGVYSNPVNFTTTCVDNLTYTLSINYGQIINKEASISVTSSSNISSGGTGIFHGGNFVLLTNNFNASTGSTFRAYIDGCSGIFTAKQGENTLIGKEKDNSMVTLNSENKISNHPSLTLFPNPTNDFTTIQLNNDVFKRIIISTIEGRSILNEEIKETSEYQYNTTPLSKGIYIVSIETNTGEIISKKLIKN